MNVNTPLVPHDPLAIEVPREVCARPHASEFTVTCYPRPVTDEPRIEQWTAGERHVVVRPVDELGHYEVYESCSIALRTFSSYDAAVAELERDGFHLDPCRGTGDCGLAEDPTVEDTVSDLMAKLGIDEAQARFYLSNDKSCTFAVSEILRDPDAWERRHHDEARRKSPQLTEEQLDESWKAAKFIFGL